MNQSQSTEELPGKELISRITDFVLMHLKVAEQDVVQFLGVIFRLSAVIVAVIVPFFCALIVLLVYYSTFALQNYMGYSHPESLLIVAGVLVSVLILTTIYLYIAYRSLVRFDFFTEIEKDIKEFKGKDYNAKRIANA